MAKIRLGNVEITLETKEVLELIKEYSGKTTLPLIAEIPKSESDKISSSKELITSATDLKQDLPSVNDLQEYIEERGEPFSYCLSEEMTKRTGKRVTQDRRTYSRLRDRFLDVEKQIEGRYNGHWISKRDELKQGKGAKIFRVFVRNDEQNPV